ncbi:isoniazid response ATPase/transcriptional regulator IniR [[Mycobacterium] burgundiense]|uniref:Isoniazid response ATPase/transcriptional regulator IniR n=1 Tax=[Mycobacterium] burgundiense TaxID=3064286 RepID=A0ABM9M3B2_9MYCO|nr:isoniazid response ATPase/transcriptional regulator IniR [Mycolicibacterium sp. MU0053]CAJ1509491.1 isoniazid response ATPase/transcriptional regulator IniR [Mycolicibacterium sp. MU0053]
MTEVPPAARAVVSAFGDPAATPAKLLVAGGIGTGKTATLLAIREALRANGIEASTTAAAELAGTAMVIDDAEALTDAELGVLTGLARTPGSTVVVATQPCEQRRALRELMTTIERERPRVTLGALSRIEVSRRHDNQDAEIISAILAATAGLPFLVDAVAVTENIARSSYFALVDRLRRVDEALLEAMLIASLSPGLGPADIAAALHIEPDPAREVTDRAFATGLLDAALGAPFTATVHRAVAQILGAVRHHEIETALLRSQLELGTMSTDLALQLAEHGMREPGLSAVLTEAATRADGRADMVRVYRAAIDAGPEAGSEALSARLADALAQRGRCGEAAALSDALLDSADPDVRATAVRVGASVAMHDGHADQAAELFGWLGPDASVGASAAVVFAAVGSLPAARDALEGGRAGPPTSGARAARNLAQGLLMTFDQPYDVAAARLGLAAGGPPAQHAVPDTPAAVIALAALHSGDPVRARSVLARALREADTTPAAAFDHRHRLLQAWLKMQDGQLTAAAAEVAALPGPELHRRDALWWTALQAALARRNGDTGALQQHWYAAIEVLSEYSVDLFSLLPLGELWVAGVRMRQEDRLAHPLDQAFGLLSDLGNPVAWSLPLRWAGVHAAILANSPESMAPHGQALSAAAPASAFARALAQAGRAWLRVLAHQVEVDDVAAAARGLAQFGLGWDATRLAGQAALQTPDPRVSSAMLQVARDLKLVAGQDAGAGPEPTGTPAGGEDAPARPAPTPAGALSEREREVAELLLLGLPYRDIGAQLFISAKTVEHHVARIRRRLGAESRSEMLSMLRAMLLPQG